MRNKHFLIALLLAALVSSCFSLIVGLQQSVWFDEAYSILIAEDSWSEVARLTAQDVHPPVYYWALKAWMMVFGSSEIALRSMSALLLGASIFMAGILLRKCFGSKAALIAVPFLVLAPFLIRYGFEIRMYSLASLIGMGATYVLVCAVGETTNKKRWLFFFVYALLVALGVYTLYFTALLWIAHAVWLAWLAYERRNLKLFEMGAIAYVFALFLFLPWLPIFLGTAGGDSLSPVTHQLGLKNLYGILTFLFLYQPPWEMMGAGIFIITFITAMIGYISYKAYKNLRESERRYFFLLIAYFLVPTLTLVVVTYFKPIYIERYVAHFAIGFYAFLGAVVALALRKKDNVVYAAAGGLVAVLALGCIQFASTGNYNFQRLHEPSVREVATLLVGCKDELIIFADGPQIAVELMYYVTDCPVYFFNETYEMGGGFAMISRSPFRVADASELPETDKIFHVFYDEPKRVIPSDFSLEGVTTIDAMSVATYQARDQ